MMPLHEEDLRQRDTGSARKVTQIGRSAYHALRLFCV
jgi:hypothetical protein